MFIPKTKPITRLFLIRHSHTAHNENDIISSKSNISLEEKGLKQNIKLAKRLKNDFSIQRLYSSPMKRAIQTSKIISKELCLSINTDSNLREFDFGILSNKPIAEIKKENPEIYESMISWIEADSSNDVIRPDFPGCESIENLQYRIQEFTKKVLENHEGESVAAITHSGFIKSSLLYYAGGSFSRKVPFIVNNASITIIDYYNGNPIICLFNDTCHINEKPLQGRPLPL